MHSGTGSSNAATYLGDRGKPFKSCICRGGAGRGGVGVEVGGAFTLQYIARDALMRLVRHLVSADEVMHMLLDPSILAVGVGGKMCNP